jgi:vacuolar protein sorting-associated protein 13A/C
MAIRLSAPVEIENLLPYDINFRIIDKTAGQDYNSFLRKGGSIPLHVVENKHLLLLNIHMPNTGNAEDEMVYIRSCLTFAFYWAGYFSLQGQRLCDS